MKMQHVTRVNPCIADNDTFICQIIIMQHYLAGNAVMQCQLACAYRGSKPDPPERGQVADLPLFAALFQDECSLYLDMSGDSLHKRGYRTAMHASSLNEAAAAGVLSLANWQTLSASEGEVHPS